MQKAKKRVSKKQQLKNEAVISFLDKFKPDTRVYLQGTFGKKSIVESGYGAGRWNGHRFSFDYETCWRFGTLESSDYDVEDLKRVLESKWVDELTRDDLSFELQSTSDGDTDVNVKWEEDDSAFTEEELEERWSGMDCYWNGDINDSEYNYNGIESLLIRIDCGFGKLIDYVLDDSEKEMQLGKEKEAEILKKKEMIRRKRAKARKLKRKMLSKTVKKSKKKLKKV